MATTPEPAQVPPADPGQVHPVRVEAERQEEYARFLPLVKWLLAIPHYIALAVLGIGAFFVIIISFFAVLVTGRYPEALWDYMVGVFRWGLRVGAYVFLLTDRYPPFSLDDDPDYPVRLEMPYPAAGVERWRPLVAWILILPYSIVAALLYYLAAIIAFLALFAILFTRRYPEGMFGIVVNSLRYQLRASTYSDWLTTKYPPFDWE
jgi:Domain of unknown function (DUF4389)